MIKINLLPPEELQKSSAQRKKLMASAAAALALSVFTMIYLFQYIHLHRLNSKIAKTNEELAKLEPIVKQVEALKANKAALENRRNVIVGLLTGRLKYPKLMEEIISQLPKDIWLLAFKTNPEGPGLRLEFTAKSFNNFAIADWIMYLESNPKFREVDLKTITTSMQNKTSVMDFSVTCLYTGS